MLKVAEDNADVPDTLEIGLIPKSSKGPFPGVFLFSTPSRMIRPVTNLRSKSRELIGSFEQVRTNQQKRKKLKKIKKIKKKIKKILKIKEKIRGKNFFKKVPKVCA